MDPNTPETLPAILRRSVLSYPDRMALASVGGPSYTYSDLAALVSSTRSRLASLGVAPGDRVAIISENRPEWGIAYFAIQCQGAVAVPILPDFHANEIQHILRHSDCVAAFVSERLMPKLDDAALPSLRGTIAMEALAEQDVPASRSGMEALMEPPGVTEDSLATIVYTSGTTGFSKGVMLSHRNIIFDATAVRSIVDISSEDRMLSILPLAHTYECTLGLLLPLMLGASVYYIDKPPSAAVLLPAMTAVRPTIMLSVPLVIEKIYKARIQPLLAKASVRSLVWFPPFRNFLSRLIGRRLLRSFGGSLQVLAIGGAPLATDVEQFLREARFPYAIGYGLTETSPLSAGSGPGATRLRSAGRPILGVDIRIDGQDPATGEGEIQVKGPNVMLGYYRDPERTRETINPDGWLRTGDLGCIGKDGYLFIKGRLKNLILGPSGKNIYPEEIESALNEFDLVVESVVFEQQSKLIARAHLNYEEIKRRFAHGKSDYREHVGAILEDIRRQVNERLAHFSRLHRIIEQSEPFEKTPTQKIKRHLYGG